MYILPQILERRLEKDFRFLVEKLQKFDKWYKDSLLKLIKILTIESDYLRKELRTARGLDYLLFQPR